MRYFTLITMAAVGIGAGAFFGLRTVTGPLQNYRYIGTLTNSAHSQFSKLMASTDLVHWAQINQPDGSFGQVDANKRSDYIIPEPTGSNLFFYAAPSP